jgi:hypothetical protein
MLLIVLLLQWKNALKNRSKDILSQYIKEPVERHSVTDEYVQMKNLIVISVPPLDFKGGTTNLFDEDTTPDELRRGCGRPRIPRKDARDKPEEEPLFSNHPYVEKLWQINVSEQMILNDMDINPDKYKGKKLSDVVDEKTDLFGDGNEYSSDCDVKPVDITDDVELVEIHEKELEHSSAQ